MPEVLLHIRVERPGDKWIRESLDSRKRIHQERHLRIISTTRIFEAKEQCDLMWKNKGGQIPRADWHPESWELIRRYVLRKSQRLLGGQVK